MTLILWKAPVVAELDEAESLLKPYYDDGDESAFEPSPDLAKVASELLRRFPEADDGPWADFPPPASERVLFLSIRWGADDAVIDAVVELAREHELIVYDPQGPDVHLPGDPDEPEGAAQQVTWRDRFTFLLMGLVAAAVFWLGWQIDVPVLDWILMIVGGLFVTVVVFLLWSVTFEPKRRTS